MINSQNVSNKRTLFFPPFFRYEHLPYVIYTNHISQRTFSFSLNNQLNDQYLTNHLGIVSPLGGQGGQIDCSSLSCLGIYLIPCEAFCMFPVLLPAVSSIAQDLSFHLRVCWWAWSPSPFTALSLLVSAFCTDYLSSPFQQLQS